MEPNGRVYAYFGTQYDARLKSQGKDPDYQFADLKQTYKNLGVIHGPLPQFVTPEPVDVVWTSDNYHDMHNKAYAMDVNEVNKAVFKSLKPGGYYVIIDHKAAESRRRRRHRDPAPHQGIHRQEGSGSGRFQAGGGRP